MSWVGGNLQRQEPRRKSLHAASNIFFGISSVRSKQAPPQPSWARSAESCVCVGSLKATRIVPYEAGNPQWTVVSVNRSAVRHPIVVGLFLSSSQQVCRSQSLVYILLLNFVFWIWAMAKRLGNAQQPVNFLFFFLSCFVSHSNSFFSFNSLGPFSVSALKAKVFGARSSARIQFSFTFNSSKCYDLWRISKE